MNSITAFPQERSSETVSFQRLELNIILSLYGRMVAAGEWRDYGISALRDVALFSVFRRTAEHPLYRIEKRPKLRQRQSLGRPRLCPVAPMHQQEMEMGERRRVDSAWRWTCPI